MKTNPVFLNLVESHSDNSGTISDDELLNMHLEQYLTAAEIARKIGSNHDWVSRRLKDLDAFVLRIDLLAKGHPTDFPISNREIIRLHLEEKCSASELSRRYGMTSNTWLKRLRLLGFYVPRQQSRKYESLHDKLPISDAELIKLHVVDKMSIAEIRREYGKGTNIHYNTWLRRAKVLGIHQGNLFSHYKYEKAIDWSKHDLSYLYKYTKISIEQLAKMYGTRVELVRRKLIEMGINDWRLTHFIDKNNICHERKELVDLHVNKKMSATDIAKKFGRSAMMVKAILKKEGVYVSHSSKCKG